MQDGWNNFNNQQSFAACGQQCQADSACAYAIFNHDAGQCTGYTACELRENNNGALYTILEINRCNIENLHEFRVVKFLTRVFSNYPANMKYVIFFVLENIQLPENFLLKSMADFIINFLQILDFIYLFFIILCILE